MPQLVTKPVTWFRSDPTQPRKHFDETALRALGESLKIRQNDPLQAKPDGELIDGERRWRASVLTGLESLLVIITESVLTASQISLIRLTSFFHREDLTAWEKFNACHRLLELNPTWQGTDLAAHLRVDPSSVCRLLSASKCIPTWQEAFKAGKVGVGDIYAASKLPPEDQPGLLALKLSGATRDQLDQAARKPRRQSRAPRLSRITLKLPKGVSVVLSGREMTIEDVIENLSELHKAARKARDEGLTIKSLAAGMKDKASKP